MSLSDYKIVGSDYIGKGASSMPNKVGGVPATNKAKFDELVKDLLAIRVNAILDALDAKTDGGSGADLIGCTPIPGYGSAQTDTIQALLESIAQKVDALDPSGAAIVPTGAVMGFAMNTPPAGWLACDGSAKSRSTYSALYAAVGTTWGAGNGATTFNLPDFRGYFLRGHNPEQTGPDAKRTFGDTQSDQNKSHTHTVSDSYVTLSQQNTAQGSGTGFDVPKAATATRTTSSSGGNEARPINKAILYCIKT